jgi:hypothetical protein
MGAGIVRLGEKLAEDFNVLVALFRRDLLNDDFVNHGVLLAFRY